MCLAAILELTELYAFFLYAEMDDAHHSSIRSAITRVLPELPTSILDILEDTLQSLGVETAEDFTFIQEGDLLSVLRPVQARKLVAAWKQTSEYILTKFTFYHNQGQNIIQYILLMSLFLFYSTEH